MQPEIQRDLGRHDAQIESLQAEVKRLHDDMANVLTELQSISKTLAEARGGWRTLIAVGALASAITAGMLKMIGWFFLR